MLIHRPSFYTHVANPRRRILVSATLVVGALSVLTGLAASGVSVPDAQAHGLDRPDVQLRIQPAPTMPIPARSAPRDADEHHDLAAGVNEHFLAALGAAGIATTGREDALLTIAKRGADSHTTDADLEQSVRALFPDIDQVASEKFVYQVRQAWPGDHSADTDNDGR
jgi:hypothetical protein